MFTNLFSAPRLLISLIFAAPLFSICAPAQWIEPDKQIVREMLIYLGKTEAVSASISSRPQVFRQPKTISAASRQNGPAEEIRKVSSAVSALEHQAFDLLNKERAIKGLPVLKWNEDMARVARFHSENMARYKFFSHRGQDGSMVGDRAKRLMPRTWYSIGENIAFNKGFGNPAEMSCRQWMTSAGHRENILDSGWTASGIGGAFAQDGTFYLTQVFIN